jgi:hypothetical protein
MIIYRPHRGNLVDAMVEAKEFNNEQEMKEYVANQWDGYISVSDIVIVDNPHNDDRIGWKDTRYVCTKRFGEQDNMVLYGVPQCIGMCATEYIKH